MEKRFRLGVIGGGFMAHAILEGVIVNGLLPATDIIVSDPATEKLTHLREMGVTTVNDNRTVANACDYLLLAVKPQVFPEVAGQLNDLKPQKVVTIMAGVTKEKIKNLLGAKLVARAMPNLPCSIGEGMVALDSSDFSTDGRSFITSLFSATGKVEEVNESLLNTVTGVSGSGPAYVYLFIKALMEAGIKQGLTQDQAKNFAVQTVKGGVKLVETNPDQSLDELIAAVSSKGGTTVAALESFAKSEWKEEVSLAVEAAVRRAEELSK